MLAKLTSLCVICLLALSAAAQSVPFLDAVAKRAKTTKEKFARHICRYETDDIERRIFWEYGSVFIASESVEIPKACVFRDEETVRGFQRELALSSARIGAAEITLQTEAMRRLLEAIQEASSERLRITPLDGTIAGTRSYADTARLWSTRVDRALDYWLRRGRIQPTDVEAARSLSAFEQVPLILKWEQESLWFSTGFDKSILTSVAAPGTSQHLSGLAFDIVEYRDNRVRSILNTHGWYQTIRTDAPHFTYLGVKQHELPSRGLEMVVHRGSSYWVPSPGPSSFVGQVNR